MSTTVSGYSSISSGTENLMMVESPALESTNEMSVNRMIHTRNGTPGISRTKYSPQEVISPTDVDRQASTTMTASRKLPG